ncbi:MAG: hypothetical protein JSW50_04065, partial [Candidatus Latescibacterota bacterium]
VRGVGWLSRDDFVTRDYSNAGPTIYTPDAQCLGTHRFEYGIALFGGDHISADIKSMSRRYRVPVLAIQGVEDQHERGRTGLVSKQSRRTCISAVKKHSVRDTLVVRLYNLTGDEVDDTLRLGAPIRSAWIVDLLEERITQLPISRANELPLTLGPHEIVTVEAELEINTSTD